MIASASDHETFSLMIEGASSTRSLASLRPSPGDLADLLDDLYLAVAVRDERDGRGGAAALLTVTFRGVAKGALARDWPLPLRRRAEGVACSAFAKERGAASASIIIRTGPKPHR